MLFLAAPKDPLRTAWCINDSCVVAFSDRRCCVGAKGWHESSVKGVCLEWFWSWASGSQGEVFDFCCCLPPPTEVAFYFFYSVKIVLPVVGSRSVSEVVGIMQPLGRSCLPCDARLSTGPTVHECTFSARCIHSCSSTHTHAHTHAEIYVCGGCLLPVRLHFGFTSRALSNFRWKFLMR